MGAGIHCRKCLQKLVDETLFPLYLPLVARKNILEERLWPLATNAKTVKTSLRGEPVDITILPDLVIENIFEHVVENDGDCAILNLSLVCRRWKDIVASDTFRRYAHFQWLSKVYNWDKASSDFKEQYFVMYSIRECLGCDRWYKGLRDGKRRCVSILL